MKKNRKSRFLWDRCLLKSILRWGLTFILSYNLCFSVSGQTPGVRITLDVTQMSVPDVLHEMEKQMSYTFMYHDLDLMRLGRKDLQLKNVPLDVALEACLKGAAIGYEIVGNEIILKRIKKEADDITLKKITGKVTDRKKNPLPGVTIRIEGTNTGVTSGMDGQYSLECPQFKNLTLQFTFVGMKPVKITVGEKSVINVVMEEDNQEMDEVVVTGIFERKTESFTGGTATFKADELKKIGGQNVLQSLKTLDPSFSILESRDYGSDPNRLPDIEIRGKSSVIGLKEQFGTDPNQPLFILDGFETELKTIVDLNMDRVSSVTILKDAASTAIYGSKAANGVVVIETKKPEAGKFRVTYSGNMYVSVPDLSDYNLMNSEEKLEFEKKAGRYTSRLSNNKEQLFLDSLYNVNRGEIARGVNTYWMSEPLRTAITHKHNLYAEGGDDAVRYGIGFTYNGTNGVMKQSSNDLIGASFDLTYRKGNFSLSNKMSYDYYQQEDPIVSFSEFAKTNPYYRKNSGTGEPERYLANMNTYSGKYLVDNPIYNSSLNSFKESDKSKFDNKLNAEYKIFPQLVFRGRFAIGLNQTKSDDFKSPEDPVYENTAFNKKGAYISGVGKDFYYDGDMTLSYGRLFREKHQINAIIGARMRSDESMSETNRAVGFPIGDFTRPSFSTGYEEGKKPTYSKYVTRSNSFYFNGGYSYANRYLLDANIRLEGASVFGTNKRYSETWAVGLAWNLHNEKFMENIDWMDRLKIRASVGNPGNQNFSSFQSFTTYAFNNWIQNAFGTSMIVANFGNPDLEWQKTLDKNIGFDLTLMGNRLNVNFDYYNKVTDPLLASISVPSSVGVKTVMTNMGEQLNAGFSGTVKYSPIYRPNDRINWTLSLNFKHQKAEYRNIGNSLDQFNKENENKSLVRYYDGGSPTSLWAVKSLGINPSDGREVFLNKEGKYTFDYDVRDEVIVGNTEPKIEGVIGSMLYYKGFSFSVYFRYSMGADIFTRSTYTKVENISESQLKYNQDKRALYDRWQNPGDKAKFKGISLTETTPISSRFVLRENYIKAESISVGYDFDSQSIQKLGIQSLRLQANTTDLFRISSIKEERGIEYPFARSFSFSLSVMF